MGGSSRYRARVKARAAKMEADRQHREALEAERRNREAMEAEWVRNKSLYICTYENHGLGRVDARFCYSVQAIKLSDLFSFSETPITISYSRSLQSRATSISEDKLLREVDYIYGRRVPRKMGFGVFGSQIVLAGGGLGKADGCFRATTRVYVLETDSSVGDGTLKFIKGSNPRVGGDKLKRPKPHYVLPELQAGKCVPLLVGIKGKLYALNTLPINPSDFPIFEVYDPETKVWTALPDPPFDPLSMECSGFFSCAVVGTKILVSPWIRGLGRPVFCFDVAEPTAPWRERLVHDRDLWKGFPDGLILDLEEDDDDKILFARCGGASIKVYHMKLSNDERIPLVLECVATMILHCEFKPYSFTFAHLGGRKVCVTLLDNWIHYKMRGFFFTFEYSFLKSAASPESSHSEDPYFTLQNSYNSSFRSFSAKSLGWRNVEYNWSQDSFPCFAELCGCAVL